jgi:hypothetical protein
MARMTTLLWPDRERHEDHPNPQSLQSSLSRSQGEFHSSRTLRLVRKGSQKVAQFVCYSVGWYVSLSSSPPRSQGERICASEFDWTDDNYSKPFRSWTHIFLVLRKMQATCHSYADQLTEVQGHPFALPVVGEA